MPKRSTLRPVYKFIVWSLAVISLVFLVSRPRYGVRTEEVKRQGLELVIALDISNSMLAEDIKPNRLTAAKRAINQLIGQLENDRISDSLCWRRITSSHDKDTGSQNVCRYG